MGAKASINDSSIRLSGQHIVDLEADVKNLDLFSSYVSPKLLDLHNNQISNIPPRICREVSKAFSLIEHLHEIDLSFNKLKNIPNSFFGLVNVKKLRLNSNLLESVPNKLAASLYQLEVLHFHL